MTDKEKLEAIRAEIHRLVDVRGYDREMANDLFAFMNSLPNEPVSEEFKKEIGKVLTDYYGTRYDDETTVELSAFDIVNIAHHFAKWGKNQAKVEIQAQSMALAHGCPKESVSEGLKKAMQHNAPNNIGIDDLLYWRNGFIAGAKWQKEHLWKPADGDDLPEIDREVIALLDNGKVVYAHRPPEYWDGKDIVTGKVTRYYPKTYDKVGWNIPNVKYWLDVELPKEKNYDTMENR